MSTATQTAALGRDEVVRRLAMLQEVKARGQDTAAGESEEDESEVVDEAA